MNNKMRPSHAKIRQELQDGLTKGLTSLERKLRARHVDPLVQEVLSLDGQVSFLAGQVAPLRFAGYASLLSRLVRKKEAQSEQERAQFELLCQDCMQASSPEAKKGLMAAYLKKSSTSAWRTRGDLRALNRRLDLSALRERTDERRESYVLGIELCMAGAAHFWRTAFATAGTHQAQVLERFDADSPLQAWIAAIRKQSRWSSRLKIASLLNRLAKVEVLRSRAQLMVPALEPCLLDPLEHPWVRRSLLGYVDRLYPQKALRVAKDVLSQGSTGAPSAFLFRALVLEYYSRLGGQEAASASLILDHWGRVDPSEHTRLRLAEYLSRLEPRHPGLFDALYRRLLPGAHADPSVAVRVRVAKSVGKLMRVCLSSELQDETRAGRRGPTAYRYASLLESVLHSEKDPKVLQAACEQMAQSVRQLSSHSQLKEHPNLLQGFLEALLRLRGRRDLPAYLEERAAAAQEDIAITADDTAREAVGRLRHHLRSMKVGQRRSIDRSGVFAQLSDIMLGRVLAHLSRQDWGIYVEPRSTHLLVTRGEQRGMRGWRIWHEIRHPLPNKRKGFVHTSGRIFRGELRAHPLRLDEATTTLVPGERVSIPQEQSCAPQLPFVDDLIGRPALGPTTKIQLFSSLGVTSIQVRAGGAKRLKLQFQLQRDYAKLASLRRTCLLSDDPLEQCRYVETLATQYGIEIGFVPYRSRIPLSERTKGLFNLKAPAPQAAPVDPDVTQPVALASMGGFALAGFEAPEWLTRHADYFVSSRGNDQLSLSIFATLVFIVFLTHGFLRAARIRRARAAIPLSIGGWGTRGKSGTERLKAAMFHGLGYRVFSKTTGCEAMFVHSVAGGSMSEVFVFRPYGKATIWEQRDLLALASKIPTDVFMWECMALNPNYVSILQQSWMKDDVATITNAYPDHEDIQGPAGVDVAQVITRFVPENSVVVSSEVNFAPLFRDTAAEQESRYVEVADGAELDFGNDFLELFPYQEHPRNIALVARVGEELGVDRDLCVYNMAKYVVPDLGVLKTYGDAKVRGRRLRFINGCSANERAGFMSNWSRTGCDSMDPDQEPEKLLALVVNNRADRISRSEVFSKIMVKDAGCDRFILIGTNLGGLCIFLENSMDEFLDELVPTLDPSAGEICLARFEKMMKRHRTPSPRADLMTQRLSVYARGVGRLVDARSLAAVEAQVQRLQKAAKTSAVEVGVCLQSVSADTALSDAVSDALEKAKEVGAPYQDLPECLDQASLEAVRDGFLHQLARQLVVHRLRLALQDLVEHPSDAATKAFHKDFRAGYRSLFQDTLVKVEDAGAKGDEILDICAKSVPPGVDLTLMGAQNIKGTGLDFVYRWVALDLVQGWIEKARSASAAEREEGFRQLEGFADHAKMDLTLLAQELAKFEPSSSDERASVQRLQDKVSAELSALAKSKQSGGKGRFSGLLSIVEAGIEFIDGARRYHQSQSLKRDLIAGRVSHERATVEMRELYARAKGGWLS